MFERTNNITCYPQTMFAVNEIIQKHINRRNSQLFYNFFSVHGNILNMFSLILTYFDLEDIIISYLPQCVGTSRSVLT